MVTCPVCQLGVPADQIDAHVDRHFASPAVGHAKIDEEDVLIACPLGCGLHLPWQELENHELAHRYAR
jgi:hypothetical protein